jgi:phosphatidylinositol alpha-1,6-mannosyltransferase
MLQDFGVSAERIAIVYPGVDAERFRPDVSGAETLRGRHADGNEVLLLSVGRLQKRKGHDLVIKALAADRRGLKHVKYVIAGDGEERKALEALAADCGVGDRVTFLGEVSAALLPVYYSACDVFVLPNRIEGGDIEGFGIVFLEAASAGKPVIAGRSGGVPEAVADGQTGILVSGTDPNELAETIRQLAIDASRRRRLGAAGRTRVLESFTWSRSAETLLAAHHKAVGLLVPGRTA